MGSMAVVVMAALAVGREGLETALFFFTAAQAAGQTTQPLIGFLLGIAAAVLIAFGIYRGALKLNLGKFFTITGVLLIFVAAGILAYGVHDLQEAAFLPGLNTLAFDVSAAVPPDSWYGTLLKGIFNFSPQTTVLEAIVWVAYVAVVLTLFLLPQRKAPTTQPPPPSRTPRRTMSRTTRAALGTAVLAAAAALAGCTSTAPAPDVQRWRQRRRGRRWPDRGERRGRRLRGRRDRGARRHDHLLDQQRRQQGHRVLPLRHRRPDHG